MREYLTWSHTIEIIGGGDRYRHVCNLFFKIQQRKTAAQTIMEIIKGYLSKSDCFFLLDTKPAFGLRLLSFLELPVKDDDRTVKHLTGPYETVFLK
jgi:hypothetical protein